MDKRKRTALTVLALTSVFVLLSLYPAWLPYQRILFSFFTLYIILVPGTLLSSIILPGWRGAAKLVSSFVLGCALTMTILLLISFFRLDITIIRFIVPATVVFLVVFTAAGRGNDSPVRAAANNDPSSAPQPFDITLLALLIVLVAVLILGRGDPVLLTGDSPDHIAYISAVSESHEPFPEDFYYKGGGILTRDIRKGLMHSMWGGLNALTGFTGAYRIWPLISLTGSCFFILSLYASGILLFRSRKTGLIAAFLFPLAFRGGLSDYQLAYMATGFSFGRIFYVAALMVLPRLVRQGDRRLLVFFLAASLAATGTHIAHFITLMFLTVTVSLLCLIMRKRNWKLFALGPFVLAIPAALLLSNLPYLLLRYFRDYAPDNPIHQHVQGVMFLSGSLYILNPVVFFQEVGVLGLISMAAILILWRAAASDDSLKVLFTAQISYYLLVFVPFIFPFLHARLSYLLIRMEFVAPSLIMTAFLIDRLTRTTAGVEKRMHPAMKAAGWALLIFAATGVSIGTARGFAYSSGRFRENRQISSFILSDVYDYMNTELVEGNVVLSDPVTSFSLPAFTGQYVVCPYDQHATPNDFTAIERLSDCRDVYSPLSTPESVSLVMAKYGARYLLLNGRLPRSVSTMYWNADREANRSLAERIEKPGSPFRKIYSGERVGLYELFRPDSSLASGRPEHPRPEARTVGEDGLKRSVQSGIEDIVITRFELEEKSAARGSAIRGKIGWAALGPVDFGSYVSYMRFDTEFGKSSIYRDWYGKIYRKLIEKKDGMRYRFRADLQPLGGVFPPDTWPVGREVVDEFSISVPADISPGEYTICLKLAERTHYPNYYVKDLLSNDDYFSGVMVGNIVIK